MNSIKTFLSHVNQNTQMLLMVAANGTKLSMPTSVIWMDGVEIRASWTNFKKGGVLLCSMTCEPRGTGTGSKYLKECRTLAKSLGVTLHVRPFTTRLEAWYRRLGFEII